ISGTVTYSLRAADVDSLMPPLYVTREPPARWVPAHRLERMPTTTGPGDIAPRATIADALSTGWSDSSAEAELHYVSGKGGTGKTTAAVSLALALASSGQSVDRKSVV